MSNNDNCDQITDTTYKPAHSLNISPVESAHQQERKEHQTAKRKYLIAQ